MKFVKTLLAITIAICVMLSCITVPFAAVDCNTTAKTLVDYTSGNLPLAATTGDIPAKTLTVVDTTVADPAALAGDKALWFANTDGNGTILSGRGVEVITLTNDAGLSKHVSFDFYVPEAAFYGNIRSAFSRYASNVNLRNDLTGLLVEIGRADGGNVDAQRPVIFDCADRNIEQDDNGDNDGSQHSGISAIAELPAPQEARKLVLALILIIHSA